MHGESHNTKLISKIQYTGDVLEFVFEKPDNFDFLAGQYIQFSIPHKEKSILRSYSIASSPHDENLHFVIKLIPGGKASTFFQNIEEGTSIQMSSAISTFVCKEVNTPFLGVATGTGIAPVISIIRDQLEKKGNKEKMELVFGVRHEEDVFWQDRLEELSKKYDNFSYKLALSQPKDSWVGYKGRVTEHLPGDAHKMHSYICGQTEVVKSVRNALIEKGTDLKQIHFEVF